MAFFLIKSLRLNMMMHEEQLKPRKNFNKKDKIINNIKTIELIIISNIEELIKKWINTIDI